MHAVDALPPSVPAGVNAESYRQQFPDPTPEAFRQLSRLIDDLPANLHVERGTAAQAILSVAEREGCDLIVLGEGRDRLVGPLESTLDEVVRKAPASVLVVRRRPVRPYSQLLVGTDYTDEALQALPRSAGLFPHAALTFLHAYVVPYAGLRDATSSNEDWTTPELAKLRAHLEAAGLTAARKRVLYFSALEGKLILHPLLIPVLLAMTVPVTTVLLARVALFRKRTADAGDGPPSPTQWERQAKVPPRSHTQ